MHGADGAASSATSYNIVAVAGHLLPGVCHASHLPAWPPRSTPSPQLRTLSSLQPSLSGLSALLAAAAAAITSNPQDADDGDGDDEPHPPATSSGGASQQEGGGAGGEAAPPTTNPRGTAGLEGQLEEWARRVSRLYHHADRYYHMLLLPMEEVLREAEASPLLFSYAEWVALLEVR